MEPLLLYPNPPPPELAQALDLGGYPWKAVGDELSAQRMEPDDGWAGAIVCADVEAEGAFARPYEPFQRGGLNQMRVRTDDGRDGTAIFEVTGSRHWKYFPDTTVPGVLPT